MIGSNKISLLYSPVNDFRGTYILNYVFCKNIPSISRVRHNLFYKVGVERATWVKVMDNTTVTVTFTVIVNVDQLLTLHISDLFTHTTPSLDLRVLENNEKTVSLFHSGLYWTQTTNDAKR